MKTILQAALVLILLVGCHAKQENVVRINMVAEPHTLDPRRARDLQAMTVAKMVFEGLTRLNHEEKAELAMAEKVDVSADGKTYTFTLRKAAWSHGEPVTAHDFSYAWKKVLEPTFPADQAFQLYVIKGGKGAKEGKVALDQVGIHVVDDQTLCVELEHPIPYFLDLVSLPVFFPIQQKVDQAHPQWMHDGQNLVGNGPFLLKEWKHNDLMRMEKNPAYWDCSHVKLKELQLVMVSEDTELKMYEKGELDWAGSPMGTLPVGALSHLKETGALHAKPFLATYFFRTNIEAEPFSHPLMRKAFALAIKRSEIVKHVTQGGQLPATGLLPPELGVADKPYFADGDVAKASLVFEEALKAQGLSRDTLPHLSLMYVAGERNHLIAQAVQEQWREALGVDVQLHAVERKVYFDRLSKKNYQLASGSWTADFKDGMNFLDVFKYKAGGSNNTAWESPQYRQLLDQAMEVKDVLTRKALFRQCEEILMEEMPIIPLFHYTMLYVSCHIKDVVLSSLGGIDFKWAEVEKTK
jgi:oligopeptide transport system substrate-binding protein